ncbi:hypothetical protein Bca4012_068652 [Brassica carinata]
MQTPARTIVVSQISLSELKTRWFFRERESRDFRYTGCSFNLPSSSFSPSSCVLLRGSNFFVSYILSNYCGCLKSDQIGTGEHGGRNLHHSVWSPSHLMPTRVHFSLTMTWKLGMTGGLENKKRN